MNSLFFCYIWMKVCFAILLVVAFRCVSGWVLGLRVPPTLWSLVGIWNAPFPAWRAVPIPPSMEAGALWSSGRGVGVQESLWSPLRTATAPTICSSVEGSALIRLVAAAHGLVCKSHGAWERTERHKLVPGGKGQLSEAALWCGKWEDGGGWKR